mgnify:CR=1 FL=1
MRLGRPPAQKVIQQARQLGHELGIVRRLGPQLAPQALRAHLLKHPFLKKRLGSAPEVELRVELATQPFDVEQGFLQQHQLRLNLDLETA